MNMVKRSSEMKKPNTPVDSKVNQRKYSFCIGCCCQEAKVPVKTMMAESRIITTEMPSTPVR